jgi:glycosyltransferase involved in cell wall biosynthesis
VSRAQSLRVAVDGTPLLRPETGMATYTRNILATMQKLGGQFTTWMPEADATTHLFGYPALRQIPGPRLIGRHFRWPRRLRRSDYDVFFGPMGQLPLGGVGMPSVLTIHDLAIYIRPQWFPSGQPLSTRLVVPRSIERATHLVAVSECTARDIATLFDRAPADVTVIPEGVGAEFHPLPVDQLRAALPRFRLPERFLLFVGTIEPRKNLETLLDAWAALPDRPDLVIAGGWGWKHEAVRERVERLGEGIHLLGAVAPAELPALYNLAIALAHPSHYEGFGLTPLEAMACGTPVVCSDAASLPEVVGDAALLVDPDDVEGWTAALDRVLHDPGVAGDLRRRGILRAAELSWERAGSRTLRVLQATAGS